MMPLPTNHLSHSGIPLHAEDTAPRRQGGPPLAMGRRVTERHGAVQHHGRPAAASVCSGGPLGYCPRGLAGASDERKDPETTSSKSCNGRPRQVRGGMRGSDAGAKYETKAGRNGKQTRPLAPAEGD
eukprot:3559500-Rhodomonas_salina.1